MDEYTQRAIDEIQRIREADEKYERSQVVSSRMEQLRDIVDRLKTYDRWSTPGATIVMDLWRATIAMAEIILDEHDKNARADLPPDLT